MLCRVLCCMSNSVHAARVVYAYARTCVIWDSYNSVYPLKTLNKKRHLSCNLRDALYMHTIRLLAQNRYPEAKQSKNRQTPASVAKHK